jgi:hypothetical protein
MTQTWNHRQVQPDLVGDAGRVAGMLQALIALDGHAESIAEVIHPSLGRSGAALHVLGFVCWQALPRCTSGDGVYRPWTLHRIHDIDDRLLSQLGILAPLGTGDERPLNDSSCTERIYVGACDAACL